MSEALPRPGSDAGDAVSVDDIFDRPDVPATERLPPRTDEHEYVFDSNSDAEPSCSSQGSRVTVRMTGDLTAVYPLAQRGKWISTEELHEVSRSVDIPDAFKPPWLGIQTAPRIRPRHLDIAVPVGTLHPLIFESAGTEWPWTAIGKLTVYRTGQRPIVGSGVLVGPRLLLTASHAMPWNNGDSAVRFNPAYRDGSDPRFGDAFVTEWRGVRHGDGDVTGLDYVICKLSWRIGERAGWLGSMSSSDEGFYYAAPWISVGYPVASPSGGQRPSIEIPVWVQDIDNQGDGLEIETHKFALGGWSGGPLWGWRGEQPRVVGIESGFENDVPDPTRTVFAGGRHLVDLVKFGHANWG